MPLDLHKCVFVCASDSVSAAASLPLLSGMSSSYDVSGSQNSANPANHGT